MALAAEGGGTMKEAIVDGLVTRLDHVETTWLLLHTAGW